MAQGKDGYRHPLLDDAFRELVTEISPDVAHIGHLNHLSTGFVDARRAEYPHCFTMHDFWLMCPRGQFIQRNFNPVIIGLYAVSKNTTSVRQNAMLHISPTNKTLKTFNSGHNG
ncbi:MAG: hypothetical protein IPP69_10175 [Flavobacteriales bacterium]|nr:hypothetical protein [Flavobacteriales bacterium]